MPGRCRRSSRPRESRRARTFAPDARAARRAPHRGRRCERRRVAHLHRRRPPSIAVPPLFPAAGIVYHGRHVIRRNRMSPAPRFVGSEVKRLEDPRLIRGQAQYTDDLVLRGLAHAHVVRASHAHARLTRLDVARAAAHPGVLAVFTARDLQGEMKPKPLILAPPNTKNPPRLTLATDVVRFAGEPVAFVVALDRASARDAADLVEVEYAPLPALVDPEQASQPGAPSLYPEVPGNVA